MSVSDGNKRGTVVMLLLSLLEEGDKYGYQIVQELRERSNGAYALQESSMYPTLYRLLDAGQISDKKEIVGKRRARIYYHLEPSGKEFLESLKEEYLGVTACILDILNVDASKISKAKK